MLYSLKGNIHKGDSQGMGIFGRAVKSQGVSPNNHGQAPKEMFHRRAYMQTLKWERQALDCVERRLV